MSKLEAGTLHIAWKVLKGYHHKIGGRIVHSVWSTYQMHAMKRE